MAETIDLGERLAVLQQCERPLGAEERRRFQARLDPDFVLRLMRVCATVSAPCPPALWAEIGGLLTATLGSDKAPHSTSASTTAMATATSKSAAERMSQVPFSRSWRRARMKRMGGGTVAARGLLRMPRFFWRLRRRAR